LKALVNIITAIISVVLAICSFLAIGFIVHNLLSLTKFTDSTKLYLSLVSVLILQTYLWNFIIRKNIISFNNNRFDPEIEGLVLDSGQIKQINYF
jgi:hypothetical protein